jgi:ubiquinone/menaquinone biosynthesis C-methylase UbiE
VIESHLFETLRHEYDPGVLDRAQRTQRAQRLYAALCAAGLWRPQARLLDIGCGSGLLLAALGDDVRQRVGCDLRGELYVQVREQVPTVLFAQADGMQLPFPDDSFDLVTCLAVIGEFVDWRGALQEMARCVAPGGVLYVTVTNGKLLIPLYRFVTKLGIGVCPSWWEYGLSSLRLATERPEEGFGVPTFAAWRYIHLTPYLAHSQWSWLRVLPFSLVDWGMRRFAPSFGFAWQRPLQLE